MSTAKSQTPAATQSVPIPDPFPITWDDPRDAKLTWMCNERPKEPIPLMIYDVVGAFLVGSGLPFEHVGLPFSLRISRFNTYLYIGMVPTSAPPEAVMRAMGLLNRAAAGAFKRMMSKMTAGMSKKQLEALNPIVERFEAYWDEELLPEIKENLAFFESVDLRGMSLEQMQALLVETIRRVERMGTVHGLVLMPGLFSVSQFEELYRELFEGASTLDALRLTQDFENKIMEGDRALWRLSRTARANPAVSAILAGHAAGEVIPALESSEACQPFLSDLQAWLAQYGQRLNHAFALSEPSWIEDPTPAIEYLQAYLAQAEPRPEMDPARLVAEREKAVAEARARLKGYPQPVVHQFETLLKAAQIGAVVLEDHNYWIDQRLFYHVRRVILAYGRRLAQSGVIETAEDVFYLSLDDLRAGRDASLKKQVEAYKAEIEQFSHVTPPSMVGTPPAFDMGDGGPMIRALFKGELSSAGAPQSNTNQNQVKGLAGSAGVVRGTARVICSLAEADRLQPGDVLVAPATVPPWTPLFATAVAVVTDSGGVLCHSAVVAREYHIPAVVGTGNATTTLKDGQWIEVDGNAGTVRVVTEEKSHEPALVG